PDHGGSGGAFLGGQGVDAAVRAIVHVAGGHGPRLVGVRALADEDQLVAEGRRAGGLGARSKRARIARRPSPAGSSQIFFWRTPRRASTQGRSLSVKTCDAGPATRRPIGSTLPVMIARTVAPCFVEIVFTQPLGR